MPEAALPAHVDYTFDASYRVGDDGALAFPCTRRDLVVQRLELTPAPEAESFEGGLRTLRYPPRVEVRARGALRAYARADGSLPLLDELLPGAALQR